MKKFKFLVLAATAFSLITCKGTPIHVDENFVDITFNAGNGIFKDTQVSTKLMHIRKGLTWKDVKPLSPQRKDISISGQMLSHWNFNGSEVQDNETFNSNVTLTAQYIVVTQVNVTFKCDDYSYLEKIDETYVTSQTLNVDLGTTYGEVKEKLKPVQIKDEYKTQEYIFRYYKDVNNVRLPDNYELKDGDEITADCGTVEKPSNFETDDWELFGYIVTQYGLDYIKTHGHNEYGYQEDLVSGSFVGLERNVNVFGKSYKVRVIGEGQDVTRRDDTIEYAALTFEFEQVIENPVIYDPEGLASTIWASSQLRNYLNNQFLALSTPSIKGYVKSVWKPTYSSNTKDIDFVADKMFLLSPIEYNINATDHSQIRTDEGLYNSSSKTWVNHYTFYNSGTLKDKRTKLYYEDDHYYNCEYFNRSPDPEPTAGGYAFTMNKLGDLNDVSQKVNYGSGISPAFCI